MDHSSTSVMNDNVRKNSNDASNLVHTIDFSTQGYTTVIYKDAIRYEQLAESSIESVTDVPINLRIQTATNHSKVSNQRSANADCHISNTNNKICGKCHLCSQYSNSFNNTTTNIKIMLLYYYFTAYSHLFGHSKF